VVSVKIRNTASDEEVSIIRGLDMGGDDYITKPFKLGEVLSRINALLRSSAQSQFSNKAFDRNRVWL
jgi:two-component system response regulator RegX3